MDINEIRETLPREELYLQLAEEALEIALATLKLRRAETKINPTTITAEDAYRNLLEEIADVSVCLKVLDVGSPKDCLEIQRVMHYKQQRWVQRLREQASKCD